MAKRVEISEDVRIAAQWMSKSTFPNTTQQKMTRAVNAFGKVWDEFYPNDLRLTAQKLQRIHLIALKRGLYKAQSLREKKAFWDKKFAPIADASMMTPKEIAKFVARQGVK